MNIPKNINNLLDKYYRNECNPEEIEIVESFFNKLQENGLRPENVKNDLFLRNKIYQNIQKEIAPKRGIFKKIVAISSAAAVMVGIVLFTQFWNQSPEADIVIAEAKFGEQLQVVLSDASVVHLNSGSILKYPKSFTGLENRSVILEGEGFFEVTKNKKQPFIVKSGAIRTKVLGTKFVVNTFKTNYPEVIVTEGKVNVSVSANEQTSVDIMPNQKVVYDAVQANFIKNTVISNNYAAWINGDVVFNDSNIKEIGKKLERRFNIKVLLDPKANLDCSLNGKYAGDQLMELLESIHFVYGLEYTLEKNTLNLQKIDCP